MKRVLIFFTLLLLNSMMAQQVKFEASTDRTTYALNETIEITFSMNVDADNFELPPISDFRIQGPFISVQEYNFNGRRGFEKSYKYYLVPKKIGVFTIKESQIEFNGRLYKSNPLKIKIIKAIQQQNDPYQNGGGVRLDDNLYLITEIPKTNPYVNEPITIVYKLYFSYNIGITNSRELNKPKYNDFWSQNIEIKQPVAQEGIFKGQNYRYIILKKVVLYPQKSGNLVIEPLSMDIDCQVPKGQPDFFGQIEVVNATKRVSTGNKIINVKPLPENGKPKSFSGAVGRFTFDVTPSRTTLKSGESLDLNISVSGIGNLKLFTLPKPELPASLEMYDPQHTENVTTPLNGMSGTISDRYTIIPQEKGDFTIKPIQFSYFDLNSNTYKTITSKEIHLNVLQGSEVAKSNVTNDTEKTEAKAKKTFAFIKLKTTLKPIESDDFLGSNLFYGLLIVPFLAIPALVLFRKRKEAEDADIIGNKKKKSNALAKKYLSEAKKQINNKEPFYIALEKAMHNFLKAKLNIETSEMSKDKITELLLSRNANSETVNEFIVLTESCELARYAPSTNSLINQDYEKAVEIISNLEKQIS
ncbi:BatD family protein [Flavobacterium sp. SUN052]|uniref:BatD family protein n=1 Tax=Flavobacterium sp. SUN052 TaxID=3002441 RepID=UPI00237EB3C4|nr:BatD family protein [Flavobacterium sp. SUN052]MEC4004291.1 BatD family protein [Flavobacterium sp. SUN052]